MKVELEEYQPKVDESFYCSKCDNEVVHSPNKETGSFFVVFGHSFNQRRKAYNGEYTGVMFAVCSSCLKVNDENQP